MVFARTEYDEPLEHRGEVEAGSEEEASRAALEQFGEEWLEMWLVPQSKVYYAEREEEVEVEA
jgi:1,2-phenylacetyl-CoA epoxidase PaaB subunit